MYFFLVWDLIANIVWEFYNVIQSVGPFWGEIIFFTLAIFVSFGAKG